MGNKFSYVTTQSGPVVPAKEKSIETFGNIIANMQGKYRKGDSTANWSDLAKKFNSGVKSNYITIKDVLKKALNEAVTSSRGQSLFRLDLGNVVMDSAHAKFLIDRKNRKVVTELLYPNDNGNITIRFNVDNIAMKMYEVSLDSEYYLDNFGKTILMCCDDCIKEVDNMAEEDDLFGEGDEFAPMMASDMRTLNSLCALMEDDESGEFGEADFSSDAGDDIGGDSMEAAPEVAGLPSDDMGSAWAASDDDEEGEQFRDFVTSFKITQEDCPELDCMKRIIAGKRATGENVSSAPMKATALSKYNDELGTKHMLFVDVVNEFLKYYPSLDNVIIPTEVLEAIGTWLAGNDSTNAAEEFDEWARLSPTVSKYVIGEQSSENSENMDNLELPSDPFSETEEAEAEDAEEYVPEDTGSFMDSADEFASGGDFGADENSEEFSDAAGLDGISDGADTELSF